ncbi:MAG: aminotransferase class V-fold PLP-dependent enzyme [Vicinamibacterales bacterium]
METTTVSSPRVSPIHMDAETFRRLGHRLVDDLARHMSEIADGRVTPGESPSTVRAALGTDSALPEDGTDADALLARTTRVLFEHSLFNAHPRFLGYITSPPAPIGVLSDLLASTVNANVGAWALSPAATEIEGQAVRWIGELLGMPPTSGGLMVSGGNMANFAAFLAARAAGAPWNVREDGVGRQHGTLRVYASSETHTWLQKAADMSGLGSAAVRWIPTDDQQRMQVSALVEQLDADRAAGDIAFLVVGTAGTVSTGAVDPLRAIATVCRERGIWFHVDGAYGGFAAATSEADDDLTAIGEADSVAVDPHKWLYAPLEAGCCVVRDPERLRQAFSFHPPYYHFDEAVVNYFDLGPQNSRGFRALKVWMAIQQVGARGYRRMIADDMRIARRLADVVRSEPAFELLTSNLSIVTFRYVPPELRHRTREKPVERYLNALNQALLDASQKQGAVFVSNAVVRGMYLLRACVVNFHTSMADVEMIPALLAPLARELDVRMRAAAEGV